MTTSGAPWHPPTRKGAVITVDTSSDPLHWCPFSRWGRACSFQEQAGAFQKRSFSERDSLCQGQDRVNARHLNPAISPVGAETFQSRSFSERDSARAVQDKQRTFHRTSWACRDVVVPFRGRGCANCCSGLVDFNPVEALGHNADCLALGLLQSSGHGRPESHRQSPET